MLYLALTVLSSVLVSVILKINEGRGGHRFVVAGTNYLMAAMLALLLGDTSRFAMPPVWVLISMAAGVGFITGFWMLMRGLNEIGLAIPTSAARLSMLLPVTGSIVLLGEHLSPLQGAGIIAGVAAFAMLGLAQRGRMAIVAPLDDSQSHVDSDERIAHRAERASGRNTRAVTTLVLIFGIVGTTDFTMKAAQHAGIDKDAMAFIIFLSAAITCWGVVIARRTRIAGSDVALGVVLGIPNYLSVRFLLLALRELDAAVVFPAVSASAVVAITLVAVVFWRERPNRVAWFGIVLAVVAVVLLGLHSGATP